MEKWLISLAAIFCGLAVGLGAYGAHGLKDQLVKLYSNESTEDESDKNESNLVISKKLDQWSTGTQYQMNHGLAMLALGILHLCLLSRKSRDEQDPAFKKTLSQLRLCFYLLLAGSTIFSGGLYILVFSDLKFLGAIIPVGGVLMIAGWCFLAWTGKNLCQIVCSGSH